jgi:protein dithiol oxidoreductase (disulfide-forming)
MQVGSRLLAISLLLGAASLAHAANWVEGTNYFAISPPQPTSVPPGKVEVTEIFSFACPACDHFELTMNRVKTSLPAYATVTYLPAGFRPDEDWVVFQRAYFAAQLLGVEARTHDTMFDAVWKTGELAVDDLKTGTLKSPPPSIQDIAKFYQRVAGIKPETFVATAGSFGVDVKVRQADQYIRACLIDQTPTVIVNGRYRITQGSAGGEQQMVDLVNFLVAQEHGARTGASSRPPMKPASG